MEERLRRIVSLSLLTAMLALLSPNLNAQCTGGTMAGTINPTVPWQTVPCMFPGQYYEFPAVAGCFYSFTLCFAGGGGPFDAQLTVLDNTGAPAGGFSDDVCLLNPHLAYWAAPTTGTYRILLTEFPCITSGSICAAMSYKTEYKLGSPGNNCGNPIAIPSLPYIQGGLSTCGFGNDYNNTMACGSNYMNGDDFVLTYNGTAGECISIYLRNTFIYTGVFLLDGCPDAATTNCVASATASAGNPVMSNITLPATQTYYIVVSGSPPPNCTAFDIEVYNCVAVGVGNTCSNAFTIPALPYNQFGFTTCGFGDDYDNTDACGSLYMGGDDFVFQYTSPGNECLWITLSGTDLWTGFFVLDGCPDVVGTNCLYSREEIGGNPQLRNINLVSPGTYYIVVSTYPSPQCTPFNIDIQYCPPACGRNPNGGDNCSAPTAVSLGPTDTICGYTDVTHTPDVSTDLSNDFCGSIENNSWFTFIADSTTMTIRFDATDCLTGFGMQAMVFETADCNIFTPVSNCWNPQIEASGVVQATGLTVGNTYYMMLDGFAGDECLFEAYRVIGPLPVEWGPFSATAEVRTVQLDWSTYNEVNNKGFYIQRGRRVESNESIAVRWEDIQWIDSKGDSPSGHDYRYSEEVQYIGEPWYYRIRQVDYDGVSDFSDIRQVEVEGPKRSTLLDLYPNPAPEEVHLDFYQADAGPVTFKVYDLNGRQLIDMVFRTHGQGIYREVIGLQQLNNGIYLYSLNINGQMRNGKLEVLR